jgi:hypothetical protein
MKGAAGGCGQPALHAFSGRLRPLVKKWSLGRIGKWMNLKPEKLARMLVRRVRLPEGWTPGSIPQGSCLADAVYCHPLVA